MVKKEQNYVNVIIECPFRSEQSKIEFVLHPVLLVKLGWFANNFIGPQTLTFDSFEAP